MQVHLHSGVHESERFITADNDRRSVHESECAAPKSEDTESDIDLANEGADSENDEDDSGSGLSASSQAEDASCPTAGARTAALSTECASEKRLAGRRMEFWSGDLPPSPNTNDLRRRVHREYVAARPELHRRELDKLSLQKKC